MLTEGRLTFAQCRGKFGNDGSPSMLPPPQTQAMPAAILNVGDELLAGDIVNTNATYLAERARALGFVVIETLVVRDRVEEIVAAISSLSTRVAVCWVSGGLGPTSDDLTTQAFSAAAHAPLARDPEALEVLEEKFRRFGRAMAEINKKQADFPTGATRLLNPIGTAEGFSLELGRCRFFVMPGVPRELKQMMREQVEPHLQQNYDLAPVPRRIYRTLGRGESSIAESLTPLWTSLPSRSPGLGATYIHYRASMPEVQIIVEAVPGPGGEQATFAELASLDRDIEILLAPSLYGMGSAPLVERVLEALHRSGLRLAAAESCTGGGLGQRLSAVAGASRSLLGGIIAYDDAIKTRLLGVPESLLAQHGAVSESVARAMAHGAREATGADLSIAITGIAGPTGGSPQKPVGTVHFALVDDQGTEHLCLQLRGDRGTVQKSSEQWALKLLWDRLIHRGLAAVTELEAAPC